MTNTTQTMTLRMDVVRAACENNDHSAVVALLPNVDVSDILEAAQTLLDQSRYPGWVQAARVFGALFGVRDENDAMGLAELLVEAMYNGLI